MQILKYEYVALMTNSQGKMQNLPASSPVHSFWELPKFMHLHLNPPEC